MHDSGIKPFLSLFHKEVFRFLKVVFQTVLTPAVNSALYLLIFGLSMGSRIGSIQEIPYLVFIIPGLITMGVINNAFQNSSSSITVSKFGGDLEDLKVAPISAHELIWAMGLAGMLRGMIVAFVISVIGQLFYLFSTLEFLAVKHLFLCLFFLLSGGLSFSLLGVFIGFYSKSFEQITLFSTFFLLPLTYLGGVFFSLKDLHPLWQKVALFNPIFYFINGVKHSFLGISDVSIQTSLLASAVFFLISYFLAYKSVKGGSFERFH